MRTKQSRELWPLWFLVGLGFWWPGVAMDLQNPWYWALSISVPLVLSTLWGTWHYVRKAPAPVIETLGEAEKWRQRLELVVDGSFDGIWDWDISANKVFWSDRVYKMIEMERGELGDSFEVVRQMMHPMDRSNFDKELRSHLLSRVPFQVEIRIKAPKWEDYRYFHVQGKLRANAENIPVQMAGSITNITRQKENELQLIRQAKHDLLTDLGNRSAFEEALMRAAQKSLDHEDNVFAVLLLDIDKFKAVNDNYDHKKGDQVLVGLALLLRSLVKSGDQVYRLGGDEFVILMNRIRNRGDVTRLAGAIKEALQEPIRVDEVYIYLSVSLGIVFSHDAMALDQYLAHSRTELIQQNAYLALYQAKQMGHGNMQVFNPEVRSSIRRNYRLEQDLRQALGRGQFVLAYQPIVELERKLLVGFEVLLRWRHPELGMVSPVNFIPIAEETGLICPIGEWIMDVATAQFKKWQDDYPCLDFVSINVSAPQILQKQELFLRMVDRSCAHAGLSPKHLKLELTESVAMKDVEHIIETLGKLADKGVRISLDDFGTGYSSLSYLQRFKIHTLKIDRAFVLDIPLSPEDNQGKNGMIVDTIIAMAKTLGLDIIAEGVEYEEQAQYLQARGVEYIQGFLFGRPLSVEEVEAMLEQSELVPKSL